MAAPVKPPAYTPYQPAADAPDDVIIKQNTANVGLFSWTTNDLTSVKDIITYVKAALTASESADANAKYAQAMVDQIATLVGSLSADKLAAEQAYAGIQNLANSITLTQAQINGYLQQAQALTTTAGQSASQALAAKADVQRLALASVYKFGEIGDVTSNIFTVDPARGSVQHLTLTQGTTTFELPDFPPDSTSTTTARQITLIIKQGTGANRVNWPQGIPSGANPSDQRPTVLWNSGREPVLSYVQDMEDVITLLTTDNGLHWYGFYNGGWFNTIYVSP